MSLASLQDIRVLRVYGVQQHCFQYFTNGVEFKKINNCFENLNKRRWEPNLFWIAGPKKWLYKHFYFPLYKNFWFCLKFFSIEFSTVCWKSMKVNLKVFDTICKWQTVVSCTNPFNSFPQLGIVFSELWSQWVISIIKYNIPTFRKKPKE